MRTEAEVQEDIDRLTRRLESFKEELELTKHSDLIGITFSRGNNTFTPRRIREDYAVGEYTTKARFKIEELQRDWDV